jgi:hypothetical protein
MDGERLHVTDATREKSSREERRSSHGEGRRAEAAKQASERQSRGSERREKYTSVANESRDD